MTTAVEPDTDAPERRPNPETGELETQAEREARLRKDERLITMREVSDLISDPGKGVRRTYQWVRDLNSKRSTAAGIVAGEITEIRVPKTDRMRPVTPDDVRAAEEYLLTALPAPVAGTLFSKWQILEWMRATRRGNEWYEPIHLPPPGRPPER